jgi:hypothetical protein
VAHAQAARFVRRLAPRWEPTCWTGIVVRAIPAREIEIAGAVIRTSDHFIGGAWAPAERAPARWPEAVVIGSPTADNALAELFVHLPDAARLFLAGVDDVDAALVAEILLAGDCNLERYQRDALRVFIERERMRAAIDARYSDRDPGFERFRARLLGHDVE